MKARPLIGTILLVAITTVAGRIAVKRANHNRCAREGEAQVVRLLQNGGAFTNKGTFQKLEGEGYNNHVWNIQGYEFLDLHRTAVFTQGAQDIRIIVREGKTLDGKIGQPEVESPPNTIQPAMIYVTHPGFRP